jgi:hypothetical protein
VKESWKGVSEDPVVVYGHGLEASCGIELDEGVSSTWCTLAARAVTAKVRFKGPLRFDQAAGVRGW